MSPNRQPVAVVVGATSKWQADGRNTKLAHGKALDDRDLPVGVRWGVGGAIAQKFAKQTAGHPIGVTVPAVVSHGVVRTAANIDDSWIGTDADGLFSEHLGREVHVLNDADAAGSREAALRNHLMVRRNYEALVSGDGACAGCGEKSVLRSVASVTEAYMRPLYHRKADRLRAKAARLEKEGHEKLAALQARSATEYALYRKTFAHVIVGLGGETDEDTAQRIAAYEASHGALTDAQLIGGLVAVLQQDAFNHKELQAVDGRRANGMSVMMMGASTGCNTVYGSTPPANPHPRGWPR